MEKQQTIIPEVKLPNGKPEITAQEFSDKKIKFVTDRLNQFAQRKNMTWTEVEEFMNEKPGANNEIDRVVDEDLHSSNCPDPTDYLFK